DVAGAMTLEALRGTPTAFDERIHAARPHAGQQESAARLRELLQDSEIRESHRTNDPRVQDAYSLRCMPQIHGAALDALRHARAAAETETGSATDNPLVFVADDDSADVLSGGNFHGAPLALALDYAAVALVHLGNVVERRIDRVVNPDKNEGLPPFLARRAGVESGLMVAQIAAVALLNECKVFAHPASTDNLPTDGGKEDHVSMGMTAATKLRNIVANVEHVLAIELLCAAEGLEYRLPLKPGRGVLRAYDLVRAHVPALTGDRPLTADIERLAEAVRRGEFDI
ncbi:MAG TPA: aromatic amino acid lyase, partial [Pyrinomonadaceae bacterium]|nr:aromatic amino acid lyase [Pyrinomonadaceae bacterium]